MATRGQWRCACVSAFPARQHSHRKHLAAPRVGIPGEVGHLPALRMLPAHQGLRAHDPAAVQRELRLQVEPQLAAVHRLPQLGHQRQGLRAGHVDRRVVHQRAVAAALGRVHGHFGAVEQRVAILGMLGPASDADARSDVHMVPFQRQRGVKGLLDALRDRRVRHATSGSGSVPTGCACRRPVGLRAERPSAPSR